MYCQTINDPMNTNLKKIKNVYIYLPIFVYQDRPMFAKCGISPKLIWRYSNTLQKPVKTAPDALHIRWFLIHDKFWDLVVWYLAALIMRKLLLCWHREHEPYRLHTFKRIQSALPFLYNIIYLNRCSSYKENYCKNCWHLTAQLVACFSH